MPPRVFPTVVHLLADTAAAYPAREALVMGKERLSYGDTLACVAGFARELAVLCGGHSLHGERIAILFPNSIDICIATYAAHAAGAQVVPLNPLYTERELEAILADAAPVVLIYDAARQAQLAPLAQRLRIPHSIPIEVSTGRLIRWKGQAAALPEPLPSPGQFAFVQYTGGTTGRSKGVNLTHAAVAVNISQREGVLPTGRDGERILCVMPLFHTYALSMGLHLAAYCGGTLVIVPRYHPQEVLKVLAREKITIFPGSPTIFTGLMAHEDFAGTDFSHVHTCYSGSAPLPVETLKRWEETAGCPIYEGYGQTEAGPVLTYNPVQGERKPGSVGVPLADTEVQIVDTETGTRILDAGERGEIRARGPQIMSGYRNLPQETAESLRGGWLYTGDIGEFDADGYLYIRDRKKDMAIVGGYNVYPREVDDVLFMHPAVQDAATVGAPDAYRGEVVRSFVVLRPGASVTVDALLAHCAKNLAKYKVPVSIALLDTLPKTTVNKTDKKTLRESAIFQKP
jgi:long-chain acyl-CoA synthetase